MRATGPKPLCQCGCGQQVKQALVWRKGQYVPVLFYNRDCYSRSGQRGKDASKNAPVVAYRRRRQKFAPQVAQLKRLGSRVTMGDLLGMFQEIATDYQNRGWHQGKMGRPFRVRAA